MTSGSVEKKVRALVLSALLIVSPVAFAGTAMGTGSTAPRLTMSAGSTAYAIGSTATTVDANLDVTDGSATITGARVVIDNAQPGDELVVDDSSGSVADTYGVTGTYDSGTGVLTLSGAATANEYEGILRTVEFRNSQSSPGQTTRDITFSLGTKVPNADNDHYYEFVAYSAGVSSSANDWNDARDDAASRSYFGLQGYLVTVTSRSENDFVAGKLNGRGWIGASDSASEGTWRWVTGPEGTEDSGNGRHFFTQSSSSSDCGIGGGWSVGGNYEAWDAGEPNNCNWEDKAHYLDDGTWNDYANDNDVIDGYVVEYGGSSGDPTITWRGTKQVEVVDATDPTADASRSDTSGDEDSPISFDGGASSDGETSITTYEWDWTSDGTYDDTGQTSSHTYADPGTYTVTLRVTDEGGNTATDLLSVTVSDVTAPTADASDSDTSGDEDRPISFDGTASTDNGNIVSYAWDFDDGGATVTGVTPSHTFQYAGTYTVELTVTDSGGNTDTDTVEVTVQSSKRRPRDEEPPTADAGPDRTVTVGETVAFDGGNSTDNERISHYQWFLYAEDPSYRSGAVTERAFDEPGEYLVKLVVTDTSRNRDTDTLLVTVKAAPGRNESAGNETHDSASPDSSPGPDVVTGTPVDDGTFEFSISDTAGFGDIVLAIGSGSVGTDSEPGGASDGDSTRDGESDGSTNDGLTDIEVDTLSIRPTDTGSREFGILVRQWTVEQSGSSRPNSGPESAGENADRLDPRAFLDETGSSAIGYVEVTHTNPDSDIESVTFRFRVRKAYLDRTGTAPGSVSLYRDETDRWNPLQTRQIGETGTYYVFEADSPGLSVFTVGSSRPVFEVGGATSSTDTLAVSETVTVNLTVHNLGGSPGSELVELRANDGVVATTIVELDARSSRAIALSFRPTVAGEYDLTVGNLAVGTVAVAAADSATTPVQETPETAVRQTTTAGSTTTTANGTPTTSAGGPGFSALLAVLALVISSAVLARRWR